jgi:hypothetical protein
MELVAIVESMYGTPLAAAARAIASSPSGWHKRCCAIGANRIGQERRWPATDSEQSSR